MSERSMTKLLTGVVGLLFTFVGLSAWAQTASTNGTSLNTQGQQQNSSTYVSDCERSGTSFDTCLARYRQIMEAQGVNGNSGSCSSLQGQINGASMSFSSNLLRRAQQCGILDGNFGAGGLDPDDEDYNEESENNSCSQHLNSDTCREENSGLTSDFRNAQKDARTSKQDAERALIDAEEDWNKAQQDSQNRLNDINDRVEDAGENFKKNNQKLLDDLESKITEQDNQLKELMNGMRGQFNKWDEAYVEMRDAFRAAEQAISQAKYNVEALCRGEAQQRLDETNRRIQQRTDGMVGKKVNQSTSRVAGGKKRKFREYEKLRQTQYAEAYRMCLDGKSPAGATANNAIKTAKDNFERAKAKLADQQAVIENQRRQLLQQYQEAQSSSQQNKDRLAQQAQRISQQNFESYQKNLRRAEREYGIEQQNAQRAQSTFNRRQSINYQNLAQAQQEEFTAGFRLQCATSNGGSISSNSGTRRLDQYERASQAYSNLRNWCSSFRAQSCPGKTPNCDTADTLADRLSGDALN